MTVAPEELLAVLRERERAVRARRRGPASGQDAGTHSDLDELAAVYDALVRVVAHHRECTTECVVDRGSDFGPFAGAFLGTHGQCLTTAEVASALDPVLGRRG